MYGRPVSVGTLYHHSCHTGDRAGDCASPVYRVCALFVVVTAAALGLAALKASAMDMLLNEAAPRHHHIYHVHEPALGLRCSGGINTSFRLLKEPPGVGPPLIT